MYLYVHESGSYRQVRHLSFSASSRRALTKSARCLQSAILYALTTHKGCRKLSILSFRRYILRRAEKHINGDARSPAIASFLSRKYDQKWRPAPVRVVVKAKRRRDIERRYRAPATWSHPPLLPPTSWIFARECKSGRFPFPRYCNHVAIAVAGKR